MTRTTTLSATAALAGALLLSGASPALAQATWSLQPGADSTQAPARPAGPVDAQNPVVTHPGNAPADTPSPKVTLPPPPAPAVATPAAKSSETPAAKPSAKPSAAASEAARRTAAPASPAPTESPTAAQPEVSPSPLAPAPSAAASATPQAEPASQPVPQPSAAPASHWPAWWLAIPVALLLAAGGAFALLRRRAAPATAWEEAGMEPEPEAEAIAQAPVSRAPTEPVAPAPAPARPVTTPLATTPVAPTATATPPRANPLVAPILAPAQAPPAQAAAPISPEAAEKADLALETVLIRQSLVYATLVYRITLAAPAAGIPEGAVIAADMISAHASLSQAEQLAPDPASVPVRHRFDALAPGESREVKGEIQLPLGAIRPLRQGNAALFVPLLRLFLALPDGSIERRVFSLGLPGEGAGLAPVRIDTGPRDHAPIQAREVTGARSYAGPHPSGGVPQAAE